MKSHAKKAPGRKLTLHRETLRRLQPEDLSWIRGGTVSVEPDCSEVQCDNNHRTWANGCF